MSHEAVDARTARLDAVSAADAAVVADRRGEAAARYLQSIGVEAPVGPGRGVRLDLDRGIELYEMEIPSGSRSSSGSSGQSLVVMPDRIERRGAPERLTMVISFDDLDDVVVQKRFGSLVLTVRSTTGDQIRIKGLRSREACRFKDAVSLVYEIGSAPLDDDTWASVIMRQIGGLGSAGLLTFRQMADKKAILAEMDDGSPWASGVGGNAEGVVIVPLDPKAVIDLRGAHGTLGG